MPTMLTKMVQTHGLKNGLRRFKEELIENRLFDIMNGVETSGIITHGSFFSLVKQMPSEGANWYQPTYASPLVKTFDAMKKLGLVQGKVLFIDLGVGKGKPCVIAAKAFRGSRIVGVDLSQELLDICRKNLAAFSSDVELLCADVRHVDYASLMKDYDTVIIHNKNSFDQTITGEVLRKIESAKGNKNVFYVYNNPVYKEVFGAREPLFALTGWHKNLKVNLYRV
ncbi:MAG: hypothetical protein G01um101425_86 [Candidatus Peregrinibacteria bacterium Gr01-1014_25]|nr:MAG: hypothetical protein G01um101425_86 [Candidatus Peregrinibacteria bacterium Gr01-1014_25]